MHRRSLIIRRFGPLEFGIGYYRNGVWVDHGADGEALEPGAETSEAEEPMDVVHDWLACCAQPDLGPRAAGEPGVAISIEH